MMRPSTEEIAASDLSVLATLRAHALKGGKRAQTVRAYLQPFLRDDPPLSPEAIQEYARLDAQEAHLTAALHSDAEWIKAFTVGYGAWRRGQDYPKDAIQRRGWATAALHEDPAVRALVRAAALDVQSLLEGPPQDPPMVVLGSYVRYSDAFLARIPPHDLRHKDNTHALGIVEGLDTRTGMWDVRWSWFIPAFQDTAPTPPGDVVPASRTWMEANGWDPPGDSPAVPVETSSGAYWAMSRDAYDAKTGMPTHPDGKVAEDYAVQCQEQEAKAAKAFVDALGGLSKLISKAPGYVHFSTNVAAAAWAVDNMPRGGKAEREAYREARAKTRAESKAAQRYREHRYHVAAALAAGIFVPEPVLVEYPDLHAWARVDLMMHTRGAVVGTLPEWFKATSQVWALAGTWGGVWVTRSNPRIGDAIVFVLVPPDMDLTALKQRFPQQGIQSHQHTVWLPIALQQDTDPLSAVLDYLGARGAPADPVYPAQQEKVPEKVDLLQVVPLHVGDRLLDRVVRKSMHLPGVNVRNGTQYTLGVELDGGGPGRVEGQLTFTFHNAGLLKGKVSPKEQKLGGYLIQVDPTSSRILAVSDRPWREKNAAKASKDEANRVYEALVSAVGGEAAVDAAALHAWPVLRAEYVRMCQDRALENGFLDEPSKLNNYWRLRYAMVILGPATKTIIPSTWTDAPPWEDMAKEIVGKEAWAHKPFRAAWLAALREVTLTRFHAFLLPYAPHATEAHLRGVHAALYGGLPAPLDREALARRAETYQTLSDSQVYQDVRKARPGAPEELARRIAVYREQWFIGLTDEALADWYLLRELNRQPWPLRSEHDTADIVRLAWAEEVQVRGIPVEGDSSLLRSEAARALADRAQAAFRAQVEATRPRSPLEQAQEALRAASQAADAWLAGKPQWVRDSVHTFSDKELSKWAMYHSRADYQDALIKLNAEVAEAQHWYAQTPEGQAAKNM